MPTVTMPQADWDTVILALDTAQAYGLLAYLDPIINEIDQQVARQEA